MPAANQAHDLRRRLLLRLGVAGSALVIGLIGLGWFGGSAPDVSPAPPQAAVPSEPVVQPTIPVPRLAEGASSASTLANASADSGLADTGSAGRETSSAPPGSPPGPGSLGTSPSSTLADTGAKEAAGANKTALKPGEKLPRGPHLQAGVFAQAANAEALKARLEAEGLPVYIESRVHLGPFKDRKEAERMREKLKAQGVTTVLIAQ